MRLLRILRRAVRRPRVLRLLGAGAATAAFGGALAREGVDVGPPSVFAQAVPAEQIERAAAGQYLALVRQHASQRSLAPEGHPQLRRLRTIAARMIPFTYEWNPRARQWKWEVNLIGSRQINAFCMPGGKIAFYYGILDRLQLSDDEVAMVMGHEMTHALREHSREQIGKTFATRAAIEIGSAVFGLGNGGRLLADMGGQLLTMKFSRADETEADCRPRARGALRLRPACRRHAVAKDGSGEPARHRRAAEHASLRSHADQRHPGQSAQGRGPVPARRETRRALRPAGGTEGLAG